MSRTSQRRLTAIVFADVVAYSRLMGTDEEGTLRALRTHRAELIDPLVDKFGGRIANTAGDSLLLEFQSIVDAVSFAVTVQDGMNDRSQSTPEPQSVRFRIGVHIGDVIADGDDLLGDGVNIAARLEGLSEPGGVSISDDVYRQVRDKLDIAFHDGGEQDLKNIARPIQVWHWRSGSATAAAANPSISGFADSADKPSIAVLPLTNMSADAEQEFLADGIADDIIIALSKFSQFHVIARNSSFTFKGTAVDIKQVGRELGVQYVLEGSLRKSGNRIRIATQLIAAENGNHTWADRFDGELEDIFDFQDEVANAVAAAVSPAFATAELQRIARKRPDNLAAWELVLQARQSYDTMTPSAVKRALELLHRAHELDPHNAEALAMISLCHAASALTGYTSDQALTIAEAVKWARLALKSDNRDPLALTSLGFGLLADRQFAEGLQLMRQAIEQNPNFALGWINYAVGLAWSSRPDEAIEAADVAVRLNPLGSNIGIGFAQQAIASFDAGRHEDGATYGRRATKTLPEYMGGHRAYAANLAELGRMEEAEQEVAEMIRIYPTISVSKTRNAMAFLHQDLSDRYCAALAKAGLPQ